MLNSILANMVAGLGLFFSGLRMVDANLRQTTGRQLRGIVGRLTRNVWVASLVGIATGALVQSSSGVVFILVSLVSSGLTTVRRALPIVTWANVGCGALIFIAVLDMRLAILYLIGLAGVAYAFDRSHRREVFSALFGVAMLFYGIELMQVGAEPLRQLPQFAELVNGSGQSFLLSFLAGAALSFATQSATAVSILAIGLVRTGLLGPFAAMMALYGANVGSTIARMVLSSALRGTVRQLTAYQDLFKITGAALFATLLYVESYARVPLVLALVQHMTTRVDRQMAIVFLLFNLTMAIVFTMAQPALVKLLERWFPADEHEDLSIPQFLYEEALTEPSTALDLLAHEQLALARRLRGYIEAMRSAPGSTLRDHARRIHQPFAIVAMRTEQFQHDLANRQVGPDEAERLAKLQSRLSLLVYLEDSLRDLFSTTDAVPPEGRLGRLLSTFIESLDFVLLSMIEALEDGGEAAELLVQITGDRSDLVERIRQRFLRDEHQVGPEERVMLLQITSVFERVIWMTHRLARLIVSRANGVTDETLTVPEQLSGSVRL
jgi:phosphate:Na+ symporter